MFIRGFHLGKEGEGVGLGRGRSGTMMWSGTTLASLVECSEGTGAHQSPYAYALLSH